MQAAHPTEPLVLSHRLDRDTSGVMLLSRTPHATKLFGATPPPLPRLSVLPGYEGVAGM
jgi:hypothetical protein